MKYKDIVETVSYNNWPESCEEIMNSAADHGTYNLYSDDEMDNVESLNAFLYNVPNEYITEYERTQCILSHPKFDFSVQVDSGGNGDFNHHRFDLTVIPLMDITETSSGGSTSAGCVATVVQGGGSTLSRGGANGFFFGQSPFDPTGMGIYGGTEKKKPKKIKKK